MFTQTLFTTPPEEKKEQKPFSPKEKSYSPLAILLKMPEDFICPVSQEPMKDPVVLLPSGISYERQSIQLWQAQGKNTDPSTNAIITHIVPNITLRNAIQDFFKKIDVLIEQAIKYEDTASLEILFQEEYTLKIDKVMQSAIQRDLVNIMKLCVKFGTQIIDEHLHIAVEHLSVNAVNFILENKIDPNVKKGSMSSLHYLCISDEKEKKEPTAKRIAIVQTLLKYKANIDSDSFHGTPLHCACINTNISIELLELLLKSKASMKNLHPERPYVPLETACIYGNTTAVRLLLDSKQISSEMLTTDNQKKKSLLMLIADADIGNNKKCEVATLLLTRQEVISSINEIFEDENKSQHTALTTALKPFNSSLIEMLFDYKADPNIIMKDRGIDTTALTSLCSRYSYDSMLISQELQHEKKAIQQVFFYVLTFLLNHGAHFDSSILMRCYKDLPTNFSYKPVLTWAAEQKDETIFKILMTYDKGIFFEEFKSIYQENPSLNFLKKNTMKNRLFSPTCKDRITCMRDVIKEIGTRNNTKKTEEKETASQTKTDIAWEKLKQKIINNEIKLAAPPIRGQVKTTTYTRKQSGFPY